MSELRRFQTARCNDKSYDQLFLFLVYKLLLKLTIFNHAYLRYFPVILKVTF